MFMGRAGARGKDTCIRGKMQGDGGRAGKIFHAEGNMRVQGKWLGECGGMSSKRYIIVCG